MYKIAEDTCWYIGETELAVSDLLLWSTVMAGLQQEQDLTSCVLGKENAKQIWCMFGA